MLQWLTGKRKLKNLSLPELNEKICLHIEMRLTKILIRDKVFDFRSKPLQVVAKISQAGVVVLYLIDDKPKPTNFLTHSGKGCIEKIADFVYSVLMEWHFLKLRDMEVYAVESQDMMELWLEKDSLYVCGAADMTKAFAITRGLCRFSWRLKRV